jgi:hypothetical protein
MQGRSKVRIRALKREPYKQATVWVGSKVTKPGVPVPKKAPLHMLWIHKAYYQAFFWVLIDLIVELLGLIIKPFDNQTES